MMIKIFSYKYFWLFIFWLSFFIIYSELLTKEPNYEDITNNFNSSLSKESENLKKYAEILRQEFLDNNNELKSLSNKFDKTYNYLIYHKDSLLFWSDVDYPDPGNKLILTDTNKIIHTSNGYFLKHGIETGDYSFIVLFLIKNEYKYENSYLKNVFNPKLLSNETEAKISYRPDLYNIKLDGKFLFSLEFKSSKKTSPWQESLLLLLNLISFFSIILIIYKVSQQLLKSRAWPFIIITLVAFAIRYLQFYFKFPLSLYSSDLFSPHLFASSAFFPSLGDFVLNIFCLFPVIVLIYKHPLKGVTLNKTETIIIGTVLNAIFLIVIFLLSFIYEIFIKNSTLYILFNNLFEINLYSIWFVFAIFILFVCIFYLFSFIYSKFIFTHLNSLSKIILLTFSLLVYFIFVFIFSNSIDHYILWGTIPACVYILYYYSKQFPLKTSTIFAIILFFAIYSTYLIYKYSETKEKERRKILAYNLVTENDPIAEYLFSGIDAQIANDTVLRRLSQKPTENEIQINRYLKNKYFSGYWSRYDFQFTICDDNDKLLIKPDNVEITCKDYFNSIKDSSGKENKVENLFFINQATGRSSYLGEIEIFNPADSSYKTLFIEIIAKYVPKQLGYPELLIDKKIRINKDILNYSYAKYKSKDLVAQYGNYYYPARTSFLNLCDTCTYSFFEANGYNHLYYKADDNNEVIISSRNTSWIDILATFSYLYLIFAVFWLLLKALTQPTALSWKDFFNFSNSVRAAMIFIVLISFIIIGVVTLKYIKNINSNKNYKNITEKAHSILIELEHKLSGADTLTEGMSDYTNELLVKFSNVFFTDINLYDLHGNLFATSRDKIFSEGLISRKMNPDAYFGMRTTGTTLFVNEECIGTLKYLSAYIPLRNYNNKNLAYINLPYFATQGEQQKEISTFVAAFINIYLFLVVFSVIIAIIISRYITKPLQIIKDKLKGFQLGKVNEKIKWERQDEIGGLITEYNRLIDELAKSVELLAQSERESAWREMARQVAHEIKNPLTPMKLSLQHLQKTWKSHPEELEERIDKFTQMMISQIDTLSAIASSFSDFARMPVPQHQMVSLSKILTYCTDLYKDILNVQVAYHIYGSDSFIVKGDEMQLSRAFDNLIRNALQAVEGKENGVVEIILKEEDNMAVVEIKDNGKGITEEEAPKIFTPNFTTKTSGMGLGLAIVKNIIESTEGQVSFESVPNIGTTFKVIVPLHRN